MDANKKVKQDPIQDDNQFPLFLIEMKVEDLNLPDKRVYVAERQSKAVDVWQGLVNHHFMSVPVLQKTAHKYYGVVDLSDILHFVINHFGVQQLDKAEDYWKLVQQDRSFEEKTIRDIMKYPVTRKNPFHPVRKGYSLHFAVELLAREPHLQRVPVIDSNRNLRSVITQSRLVELIYSKKRLLGVKKLNMPVGQIPMVIGHVRTVEETETALQAFETMASANVDALVVVNADGRVTGMMSLVELKAISTDGRMFNRIFKPLKEYLEIVNDDDKRKTSSQGFIRPSTVVYAKKSTTLSESVDMLFSHQIHQLVVVDDDHKPIGMLTLKDILHEALLV